MESTAVIQEGSVHFLNSENQDIINLQKVTQKYGNNLVIDNLDLLIEDKPNQNQFVVILGRSGCGKSTLLRYITGLQKPTSGDVIINQDINKHPIISMVFQQYSNFPWLTVSENIKFPLIIEGKRTKKEIDELVDYWLEQIELTNHKNKYAKYPTLSGGQLQRVAIARSLIAGNNILLLDEPFGALDMQTRNSMQNLLIKLYRTMDNLTVIMVTHDIREAVFLADDIYLMSSNPGKIIDYVNIKIPYSERETQRDGVEFNNYVKQIEQIIMKL